MRRERCCLPLPLRLSCWLDAAVTAGAQADTLDKDGAAARMHPRLHSGVSDGCGTACAPAQDGIQLDFSQEKSHCYWLIV